MKTLAEIMKQIDEHKHRPVQEMINEDPFLSIIHHERPDTRELDRLIELAEQWEGSDDEPLEVYRVE
jgi:hypothetical protein